MLCMKKIARSLTVICMFNYLAVSEGTYKAFSPPKCYVIIHRYQVYRIKLYLSWTTIDPITTKKPMEHWCIAIVACRAVASLTVPCGQEFHFPHFFLKFRSIFLIFPQTLLIFFLILALRVGESPTWEGPGYATGSVIQLLLYDVITSLANRACSLIEIVFKIFLRHTFNCAEVNYLYKVDPTNIW